MSARAGILKKLAASPNLSAERAIEAALLDATQAEQIELADVLMQRNRRAGWVTLIRSFHKLDESIREKVLGRPRDLFGPLAETIQDSEGPVRENVINIVQRCTDVRLVYLLAEAMMDGRPEVRTLAGNSLLEAVRQHWRSRGIPGEEPVSLEGRVLADAECAQQLSDAIDVALRNYKMHRQQTVVLAALVHERQQTSSLWELFEDPYDDRTRAATIMLRAPVEASLARAIYLALGTSLKPAAMAGLASVESVEIARALAAESFRLIDPVLREAAQGITHLKLLPAVRKAPPWNRGNWVSWLRLIEATGLQAPERLAWLIKLLEAAPAGPESCAWRIMASRSIAETGLADAAAPLVTLVRDADERVARFAARLLLNRRRTEWRERAAAALASSPHISVRRLAGMLRNTHEPERATGRGVAAAPAIRGFDKAWNDYQRMPPAVQHNTARTVAADPALAEQLKGKLQGTTHDIAQAIKMIAALPSPGPYRNQIIALCGHADPRIAAHAVKMVGRLEDPRLRELLEAAAHHSDSRVRSNAVESMAALHIADKSQQVLALLNSRHNRERANAIKAIGQFNFATARECLTRMLADGNPLHRMSALWVVEQLHLLEVMRQVTSLARRDPNLRVRKRASEMVEMLAGNLAGHG